MDWPVSRFPKLWHRWELPNFILPPNLSCTPFIELQILQPAASLAGGICQNRSEHQDLTAAIAQTATIKTDCAALSIGIAAVLKPLQSVGRQINGTSVLP